MKKRAFFALLTLCLLLQGAALTAAAHPKVEAKTQSVEITYPAAIDDTNFPDGTFRTYVSNNFDTNQDGMLSQEEAEAVDAIYVSSSNISDLTGLAFFPNLVSLDCGFNKLTTLDVSRNPALNFLNCSYNQLTTLDVTRNSLLNFLNCSYNQLTTLDVRQNSILAALNCEYNNLTMLDVTQNSALTALDCDCNQQIASLDVSQNSELTRLECAMNQLTSLNVSRNPALNVLDCGQNQLTALDVSQNPALEELSCYNNQLTALDVSQNLALKSLICNWNQLTSLDVTKNLALHSLNCGYNQITALDVTLNRSLISLFCACNQLNELDVSNNSLLIHFDCAGNYGITELDVTNNTELTDLSVGWCGITELDITHNTKLVSYGCSNTPFTSKSLDLSQYSELEVLDCCEIGLTTLNVSQNAKLMSLSCSGNQLTSLDTSRNPELAYLMCDNNCLTDLDVSQNSKLMSLTCYANNIVNLELGGNSMLSGCNVAWQTRKVSAIRHTDESGTPYWTIDLSELVGAENLSRVTLSDDTVTNYGASYDADTGVATFTAFPGSVTYLYDTQQPDTQTLMDVTLAVEAPTVPNTLKIVSAKLNLDEDVDLLYTVKVDETYTNPYMVFTYHDTEYPVTDYTTLDDGRLCFVFSGVTPQCLGDNVSATLYAQASDGTTHSKTVANYSVRQYCINMLKHYPDNETLVTLLSDLLVYGEKSQIYMNYRTDALVTDGVVIQPSTFTALTQTKQALSGEASELVQWKSAGLRYENNTTMYFLFTTQQTEGLTVEITIGGRRSSYNVSDMTAENGVYRVDFNGILATEFDKPVTAVFKQNGKQIGQTATYSVNSYIYSNQNSTDAALQALVQATYNYGASAQHYIAG